MSDVNEHLLVTDSAVNENWKLYETEITSLSTLDSVKKWAKEKDTLLRISGSSPNYIYYQCSYAKKKGFTPCLVKARLTVTENRAILMISNLGHSHRPVDNGQFDKPPLIEAVKEEIQDGIDDGLTPKSILQNIMRRYKASALTVPVPTLAQIQRAVQRERQHRAARLMPTTITTMAVENSNSYLDAIICIAIIALAYWYLR